jgi:hypothetical protein
MPSQQPPCRALSPSRMCIDGTEQVRCAQRKLYRHTGKINPGGGTVSNCTKNVRLNRCVWHARFLSVRVVAGKLHLNRKYYNSEN